MMSWYSKTRTSVTPEKVHVLRRFYQTGRELCLVCQDLVSWFFTLLYCLLDLSCGECDVITLYFMCSSVNGSVCLVCLRV